MEDNIQMGHTDANAAGDLLQLVSFNIDDEEFGIEILNVQEINRMVNITRVPNVAKFVKGVINLRGKVIPIIDLRARLNMPPIKHGIETRIVVVELENNVIGFIVDRVNEVIRISKDITEPPPAMVSGIDAEYITAIGKLEGRLLILLDLSRVIKSDSDAEEPAG